MSSDKHNNGMSDADDLTRIEALLRASAEFEPERDADYNFAAKALQGRIACRAPRRGLWLSAASGMAGLAAAVLLTAFFLRPEAAIVPHRGGMIPGRAEYDKGVYTPNEATGQRTASSAGNSGAVSKESSSGAGRAEGAQVARANSDERGGPIEPVSYSRPRHRATGARRSAVPKVKWETEKVERYASGVLTPAWQEERDPATGNTVLRPIIVSTPLESGENLMPQGAGDQASISLVSYEEK